MAFHPNAQLALLEKGFDPTAMLRQSLTKEPPWEGIEDFATHPSFCDQRLYPRQLTLLKLIFLETEKMTAYDVDVIEKWRTGFVRHRDVFGVQPDIWERIEYLKQRGYRRFPHIQAVLGRRASKGFIGAILGAEQIAYLITLDNPQAHFNIRESKDCFLNVGATSQTQAQRHQFADIRDVVEGCEFLQPWIAETKDHQMRLRTPADLRRIAAMKAQGVPIEHNIASLWVVALSASSVSGRGATSYANFFDEFAFHVQGTDSTKSSENIYEDWQPSLGQFKKDALTYVPSSPFTKTGKFFELYQLGKILMSNYKDDSGIGEEAAAMAASIRADNDMDAVELNADPTKLIFQGASWDLYRDWERGPELVRVEFGAAPEDDLTSEEQQRRKLHNPEKFKVEREGQFAEVLGQYLDSDKVDAMFHAVQWREPHILERTPFGRFDQTYRIHADPSKSGANFGLAVAHTELGPPDADGVRWPHVIYDRLHVWRARDFPVNPETGKHEIDYLQIARELDELLYTFPSTSKFTTDQFNSVGLLQGLQKKYSPNIRVLEDTATEKTNWERAEKFKNAINLGWVHAYVDGFGERGGSLLADECKFLSEVNGRVVKQSTGPVTTKDLYDAASTVAVDLLHESLERWTGGRLTASSYGSTDQRALRTGNENLRMAEALGGNRYTQGHKGAGNSAWDTLAEQEMARQRSRIQGNAGGAYQPDRTRQTRRERRY